MSYTRPAYDAADATWEGASAYTEPDYDAADASWMPSSAQAQIALTGIIGTLEVFAAAIPRSAILSPGLIGPPQALADIPPLCWIDGAGLIGAPAIRVRHGATGGIALPGLIGTPAVTAYTGALAKIRGVGLIGAPAIRGHHQFVHVLSAGLIGAPVIQTTQYPVQAPPNRPGVAYYTCILTGAGDGLSDLVLPISSFSVRHQADSDSTYSLVVPTYEPITDIAARTHGEIVISSTIGGYTEELVRGALGEVQAAQGAGSQSITINGRAEFAETEPVTYRVDEVSYVYTTTSGASRWRIAPRAAIRPGDIVRWGNQFIAVDSISWSMAASSGDISGQMEIATA